jgi:ACT domain-containing protein
VTAIDATAAAPSQSLFLTYAPVSFELVQGGKHVGPAEMSRQAVFEAGSRARTAHATCPNDTGAAPAGGPSRVERFSVSRAILTIIGSDRVGIIAGIANVLSDVNVNILDISQSVIREYFTMIMMVDVSGASVSFEALRKALDDKGQQLGVKVEIQREEIFQAMHRI